MLVGTAMDMTPTILILTPVLMPVVQERRASTWSISA